MELEVCPYCGLKLRKTNWGRKFYPNHGIIKEYEETKEDNKRSYFG